LAAASTRLPETLPLDHPEFDAMAKWYDFDYESSMRKDLPFYRRCAAEGGDPVLELGAGTGRVTAHLARSGFHVTGVELSGAMVEIAERRLAGLRKAKGSARILRGDMADLRLPGKFRTVLVPFRSFHHLYSVERQLSALRGIRRRLASTGVAVIDLFNPDLTELAAYDGRLLVSYERKRPRTGTRVVQRFRMSCDFPRQMGYIDYVWDEYRGRRKIGSDRAPMRWRWFHRYEFEHLLARAGLKPFRILGDLDGGPYRADSEEMIFFAARI
jgi:SAM-dependent methyltransferase